MVQLRSQLSFVREEKVRKSIMDLPIETSASDCTQDDSTLRAAGDVEEVNVGDLPRSPSLNSFGTGTPTGFELSRQRTDRIPTSDRIRRLSFMSTPSMESADSTAGSQFNVDQSESLINNEIAKAMSRATNGGGGYAARRRSLRTSLSSDNSDDSWEAKFAYIDAGHVDWTERHHQRRMRDVCHFIRRLFACVREEVVFQNLSKSSILSGGHMPTLRQRAGELVQSRAFAGFFFLLIFYAIFGPDFLSLFALTAQDNAVLASFNTLVFLFFIFELCLNCWVVEGYSLSLRFWVDLFATVSMIGDTWIAYELVDRDVAAAGRGSRFLRMFRLGRGTRIVRLTRITRVLRVVPRLQQYFGGSSNELAVRLLQKRLWHIFQYINENGNAALSEEEREYFFLSLKLEFADLDDLEDDALGASKLRRSQTNLGKVVSVLNVGLNATIATTKSMVLGSGSQNGQEYSFQNVLTDAMKNKREWHNALKECSDDVQCMTSSCEAVDKVISSVMLKICIAVIFCIIMTSLLVEDTVDQTPLQDLMLMSNMKEHPLITRENLCSFVNSFESRHKILLFLVLNFTVFLDSPRFSPCRSQNISASRFYNSLDPVGVVKRRIESSRTLQPSQFASWCYPDGECKNDVHSMALYDIESQAFSNAAESLLYTCVAVTLLTVFVLIFSSEISKLSNSTVMHPLWEILDDICTMKCIEVIAESQERKGAPYTATTSTTNFSKYTKWLTDRGEMPTAEELVKLSAAISHLKRAMRSWVKFVPPILFQNIVAAGIEASLGVARMDVTVLFCDIADFREMIVDAKPNVVLDLIGKVLSRITNTVEDYEGQMLEFIGDEILAVFNCPATVLNHARKAVCSALVSQELMNEIEDFDVRLHIGINRARVLAGNLGSFTRMKYGVLGDGVNMAARIKSLNTRFSTCILASPTVLDFENAHEEFVTRPIGNLILKGRTVPTLTYEVLGQRRKTSDEVIEAAELHSEAFDLYRQRCFVEAKMLFNKVNDLLLPNTPQGSEGDRPSLHYARLCEDNLVRPPGDAWDGSERLTKKAW